MKLRITNYELRITKRVKIIFSAASFVILNSLFIIPANAQYGFTNLLDRSPGGTYDIEWFFRVLNSLTCYFIQFAIIAFGVMLVVYGMMFLKSRGSTQGMTDSKKALTWGLVGGFVIFAVFTIILSFASALGFFTGSAVDYPIMEWITCQ